MLILDEEEKHLRQIDELTKSVAEKDVELSQLRKDVAVAVKVRNMFNFTLTYLKLPYVKLLYC